MTMTTKAKATGVSAFATATLFAFAALAQDAPPPKPESAAPAPAAAPVLAAEPAAPAPPAAAPPKGPPYVLPFQLRPVMAGNVIRIDTSMNFYDAKNATTGETKSGTSTASLFLASYKVTPNLAPLVRVGVVHNTPPVGEAATAMTNPVLGVIWGRPLAPSLKLGLFGAVALPLGSGGGESAPNAKYVAVSTGLPTRSAFDNAMFVVNYIVPFGGAGLAYVDHGATLQAEVTLLQLFRTRGSAMEKDERRTNLTAGAFAGYYVIPQLALGGELRHQRWLSTLAAVEADATKRETSTFGVGARGNFKLGDSQFLRPAVTYSRGLDKPMTAAHMNILQVDLTFAY